jgi:chromosome segregation protein
LDNSSKKLSLDFDQIEIERVVSRDGSNEYLLNGSPVRLKDVLSLLAEAHIGASGHHIISQGEADRILRANTKERREMVEEALGLKIYQYKREESEKKLEKTEENIRQVESLRREIAPHIKFLKKQVEKVERAEELKKSLTELYRQYLNIEEQYINSQKEKLVIEKKPIEDKLHSLDKEMEEAKNILNSRDDKDEKSDKLIDIENKVETKRNEKDVLIKELGSKESEIRISENQIQILTKENDQEQNKTVLLKEVEVLEQEIGLLQSVGEILERVRNFIQTHKQNIDVAKIEKLNLRVSELQNEKQGIEKEIENKNNELKALQEEYIYIKNLIEKEKDTSRDAEKNIFRISSEQSVVRSSYDILREKEKRLSIEEEDWKREIQEAGVLLGTAIVGFSDPNSANAISTESREKQTERRRELEKMKIRLEETGGVGGGEIMKEYKDSLERDEYLAKELQDLYTSSESLKNLIKELLEKIDSEFENGIEKINKSFIEYFHLMFGGGEAKLKIENLKLKIKKVEDNFGEEQEGEDKNERGIEIEISLPKKKLRGLDMLSGGERALTSIALIFAISSINPPPFIILDETDAALDEANSKRYGDAIEKLSKDSELIIITHNRETMSRAGVIYGVTMGRDGVSRLLSIAFDEAVSVAK